MSRGAGGKDDEEARAGKKRKVKVQDKPNQPQDFTDDFTAADLARSLHDLIDLIEAAEAAEATETTTETTPTQPEPPNADPVPSTHTAPQTHVQAHRATPRPATHAYTHAVIQADTRHQSGPRGGYYAGVIV